MSDLGEIFQSIFDDLKYIHSIAIDEELTAIFNRR